jgi:hypothetical protein
MTALKSNKRVRAYLDAVLALSKWHGLSISHEDISGAFTIVDYNESDSNWLIAADYNKYDDSSIKKEEAEQKRLLAIYKASGTLSHGQRPYGNLSAAIVGANKNDNGGRK